MSLYNRVESKPLGTHSQDEPSQRSNQNANNSNKSHLPASLTKFVQECHVKAANLSFDDHKVAEMQLQLKSLIEKANNQEKLFENDWSKQTLPIFTHSKELELRCNKLGTHDRSTTLLEKVQQRKYKKGSSSTQDDQDLMLSRERRKLRAQRFEKELGNLPSASSDSLHEYRTDKNKPVIGTCKKLEKGYLRLTSAPDPSKVRPLSILQRTYELLMKKYGESAKYNYLCDQFKSLRQDLRVQLIENSFAVKVYETHAKIALENHDLGEFNQCQSVLKNLYHLPDVESTNKLEFLSYRIIYFLLTKNYDSIGLIKLKLNEDERSDKFISQALKITRARISDNYHQLFFLYSKTKGSTRHLLNCFIDNERIRAMAIICTAYKLLNLEFLLTEFHFENEQDCMKFISEKQLDKYIELKGDNIYLNTSKARPQIMSFLNSTRKVDIKGQI